MTRKLFCSRCRILRRRFKGPFGKAAEAEFKVARARIAHLSFFSTGTRLKAAEAESRYKK